MKRLILVLVLAILVVPTAQARKKKPKAGKVANSTYVDRTYNFELTVPENWKASIKKEKDINRVNFIQKSYEPPSYYASSPENTKVPRISVFVAETKLGPMAYIDSILSSSYKDDYKKKMFRDMDLINEATAAQGEIREKILPRKKKRIEIGDLKASIWTAQVNYTRLISESSSSDAVRRIRGTYGGCFITIKNGDKLLVLSMICEWNFFDEIYEFTLQLAKSLKWEASS